MVVKNMSNRLSDLKNAVKIGKREYGIEESVTGMYRCKIYYTDDFDEDEDTPIEIRNLLILYEMNPLIMVGNRPT